MPWLGRITQSDIIAGKMTENEAEINLPDGKEFRQLRREHPLLLSTLDELGDGFTALFTAVQKQNSSRTGDILFLLSGAAYTEYEEILVLALNGYGSGATKLLRALYERTVTTQYLMTHPDKVQQFIDYTEVHWYKLLKAAEAMGIGDQLSEERRTEVEKNFKAVEASFTETVCKPCNKHKLQGAWTKKPIPSQAREINEVIAALGFQGYLMPTFFLHTTFWGIAQQLREQPDGILELHNRESELHHASQAIVFAGTLMAHLASSINKFYELDNQAACDRIENAVGSISDALMV